MAYNEEDYEEYDDSEEYEDDGKGHGLRTFLITLLVIVLIAGGGAFVTYKVYLNSTTPIDASDTNKITVEVIEGSSTEDIATVLKEANLIRNILFFRIYSRLEGNDGLYHHGTFQLSKSMSTDEIMSSIINGFVNNEDVNRFTIPEGFNILQTMNRLVEEGLVDEVSFMDEIENGVFDYPFMNDLPEGPGRLEGFLYPETYEVFADASAHDIIDKMLGQFDKLFQSEYYARATELGYDVREIVTMASIIERESKAAEERPIMAGVFYNRLNIGMKLESCATIQYILGEPKEFLTYDDLALESPYNTYLHEGLPPGPICSPRMASVEAALYPDENDFIFFVVKPELDGTHNFSADYNKFLRDKSAYNTAVDARE